MTVIADDLNVSYLIITQSASASVIIDSVAFDFGCLKWDIIQLSGCLHMFDESDQVVDQVLITHLQPNSRWMILFMLCATQRVGDNDQERAHANIVQRLIIWLKPVSILRVDHLWESKWLTCSRKILNEDDHFGNHEFIARKWLNDRWLTFTDHDRSLL